MACYNFIMSTVISLKNLSKRYGHVAALSGLTLDIQPGEIFGVLGQDGAGKSTLLKILTGLVRPTSGEVLLFGKDLHTGFLEAAARFGALIGEPAFYGQLSVRRNLLLQARLAGKPVSVNRVLDWVDLVEVAHERVDDLPLTTRRRLALAQALLSEPELLLLDEPFQGLDFEAAQRGMDLLARLRDEARVTTVLATHMLHEVESVVDRVALLHEGRLLACEGVETLLAYHPDQAEVWLEGAEAAARRLSEQAWVAEVMTRPGRLTVRLHEKGVHYLNSFLVQAGYRVDALIPRRRTLQDYLFKVMNK